MAPGLAELRDAVDALGGEGPRAGARGTCALVWVEGPDAPHFLQGLLSNDIESLAPGDAHRSLLLDSRGHIVADIRVHRDGPDAFTLITAPTSGEVLFATLERYHFSEDLELIGPEPSEVLTVPGTAEAGDGPAIPGLVPGTTDLVVADAGAALARLGIPEAPAEALEVLRVERGVPVGGRDTGPRTLVQEVGLEAVAVSFTKGCYLGQETVARAEHRGRVHRTLRGLVAGAPLPEGAAITLDDRPVGTVASAVRSPRLGEIALAVVRREVAPGTEVDVEGLTGPARVQEVPFT